MGGKPGNVRTGAPSPRRADHRHPHILLRSPRGLTHRWTLLFPHAQIIVTEILDPELGLEIPGPVGRLLDAGAHAYLPPEALEQVAKNVQIHLQSVLAEHSARRRPASTS